MRFKLVLIAAIGLAGIGYVAFRSLSIGDAAPDPHAHQATQPGLPVTAVTVAVKPMPIEIATVARVQPMASVAIQPRLDGVITSVAVAEGQDVQASDLLFTLDDRALQAALKQAQANLAKDQALLENAKRNADRLVSLAAKNFTSAQSFDQAKTDVATFEATTLADQAQVQADQVQLSYTRITAPIAGRLGTINFKLGNSVRQADSTSLVTINQIHPIYVAFAIQQDDLNHLRAAMAKGPVKVTATFGKTRALVGTAAAAQSVATVDPADDPANAGTIRANRQEEGVVAFIDNTIDTASNTVIVKARFDNPRDRLWPGQFVNVVMTLSTDPRAVVIPNEALQISQQGTYVWLIKSDNTVATQSVKVDRRVGDELVISDGLKGGETVVTEGQMRLDTGAKVEIEKPQAKPASGNAPGGDAAGVAP
ncbi:MAG TPA: efflux RND transporter periplasmic adaptor subunit [Dongiaceae bacterium]|nr:efflux RND transporter periplasmic adaptor subunit [Dongiaceae bacterium]